MNIIGHFLLLLIMYVSWWLLKLEGFLMATEPSTVCHTV